MNEIDWNVVLKVKEGINVNERGKFGVESVCRTDIVVPAGGSKSVDVNSGELKEVKLFFVMRTDEPQAAEAEEGEEPKEVKRVLFYKIGGDDPKIYLSKAGIEPPELHVLLGPGASNLLRKSPNELCFTNDGEQDAEVTILICRETTSDCGGSKTGAKSGEKTTGEVSEGEETEDAYTSGSGDQTQQAAT